jgi:hypothetical protein
VQRLIYGSYSINSPPPYGPTRVSLPWCKVENIVGAKNKREATGIRIWSGLLVLGVVTRVSG